MSEPIFNVEYWRKRLARAIGVERVHLAVYEAGEEVWQAVAEKHRKILSEHLRPLDSIIDVGCGWGRLLSITPGWWKGEYLGFDISPHFIEYARANRPEREFVEGDARGLWWVVAKRNLGDPRLLKKFDWAILVSFRAMVIDNSEPAVWGDILNQIRQVADRILVLEYDPEDNGEVI